MQIIQASGWKIIFHPTFDLEREAVNDFHGKSIAKGGRVAAVFFGIIERIIHIAVLRIDLIPGEQTLQLRRFCQLVWKWPGKIGQPQCIHDFLADFIKGSPGQVIIPIMVADHVVQVHTHWLTRGVQIRLTGKSSRRQAEPIRP